MEPKDYTLVKIEGEYAYLREINETDPEKDIYIALAGAALIKRKE